MSTIVKDLIETHGVDIDGHLDREALVPVSDRLQRQGDIIVVPEALTTSFWVTKMVADHLDHPNSVVGPQGFPVVRGEAGGNTHLLLADGDVRYVGLVQPTVDNAIGLLRVSEGATAYLAHPEHGYMGIGAGAYAIRRQREWQSQTSVLVAD